MESSTDTRLPRGALAVVAVGLVASLAAWLLSTDKTGGSSVKIEWVAEAPLAGSAPATIPGGGSMQLEPGGLRLTEQNVNGEQVFRAVSSLRIEAGSAVGQARVRCRMESGPGAELGRTVNSRGAFPRSSGEYNLTKQDVPGSVGIRFPIKGAEYASLEMLDAFGAFTNLPGVVVSWQPHRTDSHEWQWGLPEGRPERPLNLSFATFWRTARDPRIEVACTLENAGGAARVATSGGMTAP